jgi:hypothetical protein
MKFTPIEDPNHRLAEAIDKEAPPDRIIRALADALSADQVNRDGSRGADHRTRCHAAALLLQYRIGRPVERQEIHQTITTKTEDETMKLLDSPAMRRAMREMLERAEAGGEVDG